MSSRVTEEVRYPFGETPAIGRLKSWRTSCCDQESGQRPDVDRIGTKARTQDEHARIRRREIVSGARVIAVVVLEIGRRRRSRGREVLWVVALHPVEEAIRTGPCRWRW